MYSCSEERTDATLLVSELKRTWKFHLRLSPRLPEGSGCPAGLSNVCLCLCMQDVCTEHVC